MRLGPVKRRAALGVVLLAAVAALATWLAGTVGLLSVVLAVTAGGLLGLAWLVVDLRRRVERESASLRREVAALRRLARPEADSEELAARLDALEDLLQQHTAATGRSLKEAVVRLEAAVADAGVPVDDARQGRSSR